MHVNWLNTETGKYVVEGPILPSQYPVENDGVLGTHILFFPFSDEWLTKNGGWILDMKRASREKRPMLVPNPKGKLFDQVREVLRFHHYSLRTERTYCQWMRRYLAFHRGTDRSGSLQGWRHPGEMGAAEVAAFLSHLAVVGDVAANRDKRLNIQRSTLNAQY